MATKNYITPYQIVAIIGIINFAIMYTAGWVMAGTIISGILLLLVAIPLIYQHCNKWELGKIMVSLDPYKSPQKRFSKIAKLEISDTKLLVYVSPKRGTSWQSVNVRFVTRKFCPSFNGIYEYKDADSDVVSITDFRDIIQEDETPTSIGNRYFESDVDTVGGYNGDYIPPLYVKGRELVWYDVYARANDFWKGFLSFEGEIDNHRAWARIKAEVKVARLTKPNGNEEILTKKQFHSLIKKASQPIKKSEKGKS